MIKKELYKEYDREGIYNLYSPNVTFTKRSGTWGNHGIIRIDQSKNFVIIVTKGTIIGKHKFDEGLTEGGLLRWQSQPKNSLRTKHIIDLINHDETKNFIDFYYKKEKKEEKWTYLGKLKYINHDNESGEGKEPVNFNWQLMNWPIADKVLEKLSIILEKDYMNIGSEEVKDDLIETEPPKKGKKKRKGVKKNKFKFTRPNNPELDLQLKELGDAGEKLVLSKEKEKLKKHGREDLVKKIKHIALTDDSAGYDILSFDENGKELFIEVKTTKSGDKTDFFLSPGELTFSEKNKENYVLYRIYDFNFETGKGKFYMKKGYIQDNFNLKATGYKVSIQD